jgi:NAD dependent epimerase/dehydratase
MTSFWSNKHVLVTGADGFIGSHLVDVLGKAGASVRAFVRYNSRASTGFLHKTYPDKNGQIEIIAGDLRDCDAVRQATKGCDVVFHLGALIGIPYSYFHPREVVETNLMGTLNVLIACRNFDVNRLVHTSTSEVYGTALRTPIDEGHPLQGQSPYSASKIGADKLVESFYRSYSLPTVTIRPFNTYGPRQSTRAVIPTIITQALNENIVRLGNLKTTRDFTFVDDTVAGFIKGAQVEEIEGGTYNLGTGSGLSIGELAKLIINEVGRPVKIVVDEKRLRPEKSEVFQLLSDNSLAREKLNWLPKIDLKTGLRKTIDWVEKNQELYKSDNYHV